LRVFDWPSGRITAISLPVSSGTLLVRELDDLRLLGGPQLDP
jgi:hypothetical protein